MAERAIGVDIDGVLADGEAVLRRIAAHLCGKPDLERARCWDLGAAYGISAEDVAAVFAQFHAGRLLNAALLPHARAGLALLARHGPIWCITGRSAGSAPLTEIWLRRQRLPYARLLCLADKARVAGDLALLVEDHWETACAVADAGVPAIMPAWPWNDGMGEHPGVHRVAGWPEIVACADGLLEKVARW